MNSEDIKNLKKYLQVEKQLDRSYKKLTRYQRYYTKCEHRKDIDKNYHRYLLSHIRKDIVKWGKITKELKDFMDRFIPSVIYPIFHANTDFIFYEIEGAINKVYLYYNRDTRDYQTSYVKLNSDKTRLMIGIIHYTMNGKTVDMDVPIREMIKSFVECHQPQEKGKSLKERMGDMITVCLCKGDKELAGIMEKMIKSY